MGVSERILKGFWEITENKDNKRISRQTPPAGIDVLADIPYLPDCKREHLLDIYYPQDTTDRLPVIIDIHGGGWMYGYKEINKHYNMYLASLGFAVVSINYTLSPEAYYKVQICECFDAFHWIDTNAQAYPFDMNNVFLTGDSAGGHLAALCTEIFGNETLPDIFDVVLPTFKFRAVGFTCGAFSMANMLSAINIPLARTYARFILGPEMRDNEMNRYCNAIELLALCKMPPIYLSSSKQDFISFQTKQFCKKLDELKMPYKLRFWDKGRDYMLDHVFNIIEPDYPESIITNHEMTDFFKKHIV